MRTEEGKLYLFVAIDRTSKFAYAELHDKANRYTATAFLKALIEAVPYKIRIVLTDDGIQFCYMPHLRSGPTAPIAPTCSIRSAQCTAASTDSRSPTIRGRTARSNA